LSKIFQVLSRGRGGFSFHWVLLWIETLFPLLSVSGGGDLMGFPLAPFAFSNSLKCVRLIYPFLFAGFFVCFPPRDKCNFWGPGLFAFFFFFFCSLQCR